MNRFLSVLAFLFLLSTASFAQTILSFKAMGHEDDAIIGQSGSSAYYLKVDPQVELNGSKLVLYFRSVNSIFFFIKFG